MEGKFIIGIPFMAILLMLWVNIILWLNPSASYYNGVFVGIGAIAIGLLFVEALFCRDEECEVEEDGWLEDKEQE